MKKEEFKEDMEVGNALGGEGFRIYRRPPRSRKGEVLGASTVRVFKSGPDQRGLSLGVDAVKSLGATKGSVLFEVDEERQVLLVRMRQGHDQGPGKHLYDLRSYRAKASRRPSCRISITDLARELGISPGVAMPFRPRPEIQGIEIDYSGAVAKKEG